MADRLYIPAVGYATVFIRLLGVVQFLVNLISCLTFLLIWLGTRCELTLSLSRFCWFAFGRDDGDVFIAHQLCRIHFLFRSITQSSFWV